MTTLSSGVGTAPILPRSRARGEAAERFLTPRRGSCDLPPVSEPRPSAPGLAEGSESAARRTARAARDLGGLLATFWLIALVVALLPSRVAWAAHQAQFAGSAWQLTVVGVAVDLPFAVASFVAANAVGMGLWALLRRRAAVRAR